jgi:hypothetical protein
VPVEKSNMQSELSSPRPFEYIRKTINESIKKQKIVPRTPSLSPPPSVENIPKLILKDVEYSKKNIAPNDIILERICRNGKKCYHINNPIKCGGFNHTYIGTPSSDRISTNQINKGDIIPSELCADEKPWIGERCKNINCKAVHCSGRVMYLSNFRPNNERKRKADSSDDDSRKRSCKTNSLSKSELDLMLEMYRNSGRDSESNRNYESSHDTNIKPEQKLSQISSQLSTYVPTYYSHPPPPTFFMQQPYYSPYNNYMAPVAPNAPNDLRNVIQHKHH